MRDILRGYWQCNEETLALVDLLTTSRANLQDIFDRYKQAGREAQEHPEAISKIKDWIAKARELQVSPPVSTCKCLALRSTNEMGCICVRFGREAHCISSLTEEVNSSGLTLMKIIMIFKFVMSG
jgi:hypothetical protein